jgi:inosose dehydratase
VRFLLPGDAATDYAAYFRLLRQHGYSGPLIIEVSSQIFNRPGYDPIATAEKCYAALAPAVRA